MIDITAYSQSPDTVRFHQANVNKVNSFSIVRFGSSHVKGRFMDKDFACPLTIGGGGLALLSSTGVMRVFHKRFLVKADKFGSVGLRLDLVKAFWLVINFHGGLRARKV